MADFRFWTLLAVFFFILDTIGRFLILETCGRFLILDTNRRILILDPSGRFWILVLILLVFKVTVEILARSLSKNHCQLNK